MLTLLERLPPDERAVYVLREAFSHGHAEIAGILDITESASRQHAHRARRHVAAERNLGEVDRAAGLTGKLLRHTTAERVAAALRAGFKPTPAKRKLVGGALSIHAGLVGTPAMIAVAGDRVVGVGVLELRDGRIATLCGLARRPGSAA